MGKQRSNTRQLLKIIWSKYLSKCLMFVNTFYLSNTYFFMGSNSLQRSGTYQSFYRDISHLVQALNLNQTGTDTHCKVPACIEGHSNHYCKYCKNIDSKHFSSNCIVGKGQPKRAASNPKFTAKQFADTAPHCKVLGCTEEHNTHFCKICKDSDSNHFSSNCKMGIVQRYKTFSNLNLIDANRCKVPECFKQHKKHFCKHCKNEDSNHTQYKCHKKLSCKAYRCPQNHKAHICLICKDQDSSHFSRNCPKGKILYHGEKGKNLASIIANRLQVCTGDRIGDGIYFTEKEYAETIALHRHQGDGQIIVVECMVNEGQCSKGSRPAQAGINRAFPEWCLKTASYKILGAYIGGIKGNYVKLCYRGDCYAMFILLSDQINSQSCNFHIIQKCAKLQFFNHKSGRYWLFQQFV